MPKPIVNEEYKTLVRRPTPAEMDRLEADIRKRGQVDVLIELLYGTNEILDGHSRWEVVEKCKAEGVTISWNHKFISLDTPEEIRNYILDRAMNRRHLTESEIAVYRGMRQDTEKRPKGGDQKSEAAKSKHQNDASITGKTSERIAAQTGKGQATIERDAKFAEAVNSLDADLKNAVLAENIRRSKAKITKDPAELNRAWRDLASPLRDRIISGEMKASYDDIISMSEANGELIRQIKEEALSDPKAVLAAGREFKKRKRKETDEARKQTAEANAAKKVKGITKTKKYKIVHGDFREDTSIKDGSLDIIITDPPYPKEHLSLYEDLSEWAAHKLQDGGLLLAMTGQAWMPEVLDRLRKHLRYWWTLNYYTPGASTQVQGRNMASNWKPVFVFVKGKYPNIGRKPDTYTNEVNDKDNRDHFAGWNQNVEGFAKIVEAFTVEDEVICDPFMGTGTTGVAALNLNRRFVGFDTDKASVATTTDRLKEIT